MSLDDAELGVTGNAQLLLGYIAGALMVNDDCDYQLVGVDAAAGTQIFRHNRTGNTYRVAVTQIGGVE